MSKPLAVLFTLSMALSWLIPQAICWGHGLAGKRFFPTTLAVDDPFVSDELSFLAGYMAQPGEGDSPTASLTQISVDFSKRITSNLSLSIGDSLLILKPHGEKTEVGFGNLEVGLKYQLLTLEKNELILSAGLGAEIGGTGTHRVGSEDFSTLSPMLFFGKGFGDLPESMKFLRPFAITGAIGPNFPTRSRNVATSMNSGKPEQVIEENPTTLTWGISLQYSLQYLQAYVKDIGLGLPFNRMILVVEFPLETCLNRSCSGKTTGFVNPGVIWFGKSIQLGIELQVPINNRSGKNVGVLGLAHFFIDDLFPTSIGRPIFIRKTE